MSPELERAIRNLLALDLKHDGAVYEWEEFQDAIRDLRLAAKIELPPQAPRSPEPTLTRTERDVLIRIVAGNVELRPQWQAAAVSLQRKGFVRDGDVDGLKYIRYYTATAKGLNALV